MVCRASELWGRWPLKGPHDHLGQGKMFLVWHGAKKLLVWVWKPLVSLAVLFHLHKKLRAPLRDKGNNSSQEKWEGRSFKGPGNLLDFIAADDWYPK